MREPGFSQLFETFSTRLRALAPAVRLSPCYWGGDLGATLGAGGLSVPYTHGRSRSGIGETVADTDETEAWAELCRNPLAELALAAAHGGVGEELPPGAPLPAERPQALLAALELDDVAAGAGLSGRHLAAALADVSRSPLLGRAATALPDDGDLAWRLARALVAAALSAALAEGAPVIPDGTARDAAVAALAERMGARPRGSERGVGALLARPAVRLASRHLVRRRRALTEATHPAAADIMLYLARGEPLRRHLRELVGELNPPVVVVGHSLGGIIALDTLIASPLPQVELLVTVGSQGPFLYESGALPGLVHPEPLPDHVPRWLNLYDRRDLLGYVGGQLFPGRVSDIEVDNGQPFPAAHSAYWTNPAVYRAITEQLP
ncbi:alpha/beta fold hydrolase [Streptomyces sp. 4N509B]|uniref:alpha/beta fold hydrolase n=1 Tax=Streptomyces sp. 4N509B TaxID=3457413 RepID=UPI003FCF5FA8